MKNYALPLVLFVTILTSCEKTAVEEEVALLQSVSKTEELLEAEASEAEETSEATDGEES